MQSSLSADYCALRFSSGETGNMLPTEIRVCCFMCPSEVMRSASIGEEGFLSSQTGWAIDSQVTRDPSFGSAPIPAKHVKTNKSVEVMRPRC